MDLFLLVIIAVFFTILGILLVLSVKPFKKFREDAINSRGKDSTEENEYKGILRLLWANKLLGGISIAIGWIFLFVMAV